MDIDFRNDFAQALEIMKGVEAFYDSKSRQVVESWKRDNLSLDFMNEFNGFKPQDFYVCCADDKPIGAFVAYDARRTQGLYAGLGVQYDFAGAMFLGRLCFINADHNLGAIRGLMSALTDWAKGHGYRKVVGDAGKHQTALRKFYERLGAQPVDSFLGADGNIWIVYEYQIASRKTFSPSCHSGS